MPYILNRWFPITVLIGAVALSECHVTVRDGTNYSGEDLSKLWEQIGPVAIGPVTTTVSPTKSVFPTPGLFHPLVPSYEVNLSSVKLPDDFPWGLASSAYQIEGAAKDEGKGPSIWDLISHRVPDAIADNTTVRLPLIY